MKKQKEGGGTLALFLRDGISRGLVSFTAKGRRQARGKEEARDGLKERLEERERERGGGNTNQQVKRSVRQKRRTAAENHSNLQIQFLKMLNFYRAMTSVTLFDQSTDQDGRKMRS